MTKITRTRITVRHRDWLVFRLGVLKAGEHDDVVVCPNCAAPIADVISDAESSEESFDAPETELVASHRYQLPGEK